MIITEKDECEEPESNVNKKESAVSNSEDLDITLLLNLNINNTTDNTNFNNNNNKNNKKNNEDKNNLSLKIDTESIINSPNRPQSINSASSTGSKLSSFVPTFTSLFTTTNRNLRSISSAYFNKSNRLSTPSTEILDSPTHSTIDTGDEETNYLLARLEEQNNLLQNDPKNSSFESLKANFQAIKNKEKDSDLDWGNFF